MVALRRGEVENCVACCNEASCIFPLESRAIHRTPVGRVKQCRRFDGLPGEAARGRRCPLAAVTSPP